MIGNLLKNFLFYVIFGVPAFFRDLFVAIQKGKVSLLITIKLQEFAGILNFWKVIGTDAERNAYISQLLNVIPKFVFWMFFVAFICRIIKNRATGTSSVRLPKTLKKRGKSQVDGIVFGKVGLRYLFSPEKAEGHCCIFGGSGSGKTKTIAIPSLMKWHGTAFCIDLAGDITANLPQTYFEKKVFEPENPDTLPFDIFGFIDSLPSENERNKNLEMLAHMLIPEEPNQSTGSSKFFTDGGRDILAGALIAFYHKNKDFPAIVKHIAGTDFETLFEEIKKFGSDTAQMYINQFTGGNPVNVAGCYQMTQKAIKEFATNSNLQNVRRPSDGEDSITPADIEDNSIILRIPENEIKLYTPLMNMCVSSMFYYIKHREPNKHDPTILLVLDEFTALKLDAAEVNDCLARFRKRKCRAMILTQSLADFWRLYGHDTTEAFLSNIDFQVLTGKLNDRNTADFFSSQIGEKEQTRESKSRTVSETGNKSHTTSESSERVRRIQADDIDRICSRGRGILINSALPQKHIIFRKRYLFHRYK